MLFNLAGAGWRDGQARQLVRELSVGDEVVLRRDLYNAHDENAIKVFIVTQRAPNADEAAALGLDPNEQRSLIDDEVFVGFVERNVAERLAEDMDMEPDRRWTGVVQFINPEADLKPLINVTP